MHTPALRRRAGLHPKVFRRGYASHMAGTAGLMAACYCRSLERLMAAGRICAAISPSLGGLLVVVIATINLHGCRPSGVPITEGVYRTEMPSFVGATRVPRIAFGGGSACHSSSFSSSLATSVSPIRA